MKTFYIPIHFHEQEPGDEEIVMLVTQRDTGKCELDEMLMDEVRRHKNLSYPSQEDMVDAIFNSLVKKNGGVWSYCDTLNTLFVEYSDSRKEDDKKIAVDAKKLAALLLKLNAGETIDFYLENDEEAGETKEAYGASIVNDFESYVILINYYGGGAPCVIDITCYDSDLDRIRDDLVEYLRYLDNAKDSVYVNMRLAQMLEAR